jgi:hypothetical protein
MPDFLFRTSRKLARLTRDFPRFVRTPLDYAQADDLVRRRLAQRESSLARLVERGIYVRPTSPYAQLLREVGCELGDVRALLTADGVEGTLETLAARGVYLTFDELKGRRTVVRGSRTFQFQEWEFDNPFIFPHVEAWSGGTRGPQTSVKMTLPYFSDLAANTALALQAHRLWDAEHVVWLQGFTPGFIYAALGRRVSAWFHPTDPFPRRLKLPSWYLALLGWLSGQSLPFPRYLSVREPERLVEWLVRRRRRPGDICVTTYASSAVRMCLRARERGIDLSGVSFITLGEPFTPAKLQALEAVGARVLVRYAFTEAGIIGYACGTPRASDDLHFLADSYGLIRRQRRVGDEGPMVEALLYSSLLPTAPKLLLNVESGDFAQLEQRACDCAQGAAGLETHLSGIRSFEKLSSEGMTFVQTDLLRVLEEVLPERFGGTSADYQVVEREGAHGILQLALVASPALGELDENELRAVFLEALGGPLGDNSFGASVWRQLGSVVVQRDWPMPTAAGKILPFHLAAASASRHQTQ